MLNEQETDAMCAMVSAFERQVESRLPGYLVATWNLRRLAATSGDEWESIVRTLLANRTTLETFPAPPQYGGCTCKWDRDGKNVVEEGDGCPFGRHEKGVLRTELRETPAQLPHLDTCKLKYGGTRCTCGLL